MNSICLVDCRAINTSGMGRTLKSLLLEISRNGLEKEFHLFGNAKLINGFLGKHAFTIINTNYSFKSIFGFIQVSLLQRNYEKVYIPHFLVPLKFKSTRIIYVHYDIINYTQYDKPFWRQQLFKFIYKRNLSISDNIIFISEYVKNQAKSFDSKFCGVTLYVPVDEIWYEETRKKRKEYFIFIGNLKKHKNLDLLITYFSKNPNLFLKIVGASHGMSNTVKQTRMDNVEWLTNIDDLELRDIIAESRALIQPSFEEGFGLPIIQAQAQRTPVLASNIEVLKEVSGGHALFFDPKSIESLDIAIHQLLTGEYGDERLELGKSNANKFFSPNISQRYIDEIIKS